MATTAPKEGTYHHGNVLPKEEGGVDAMATAARHWDVLGPGTGEDWDKDTERKGTWPPVLPAL